MKQTSCLQRRADGRPLSAWRRTVIGGLPFRQMLTAGLGLVPVLAVAGCRYSRVDTPATASLHPEHETRMSSHPMPGYAQMSGVDLRAPVADNE